MRRMISCLALLLLYLSGCAGTEEPDASNPGGQVFIQNKGSDTIVNLALAWAERYNATHPEVRISVTGGGTGTGMVSLFNGTADIANASRPISAEELKNAQAAGIEPVEYVIARDAIAVIVNPANPVERLTIDQVAAIYKGDITNWSQVGGEDRPVVKLSRESNSGTHVYFLETVIRKGSKSDKSLFSPDTLLLPSSEGIISEVRDNPNAIGYDGLGYVTEEVKVVGVAGSVGGEYVWPTVATASSGEYPIARDLYMYTRNDPKDAILAYLDWIHSDEAQQIVNDLGFVPVAAD